MTKTLEEKEQEEIQEIEEELLESGDDLISWMDTLSGINEKTLKLIRLRPDKWGSQKISGHLTTLPPDSRITEDEIKEEYGGGVFQIRAFARDKHGRFVQVKAKNIEIAGLPKVSDPSSGNGKKEESPEITKFVLDKMEKVSDAERGRADKMEQELRQSGKLDSGLISAFTDPLKDQVRAYQEELKDMKAVLESLRTQKPDTAVFEKMVDKAEKDANEERKEAREFRNLLMQKPDTSSQDRLVETLISSKSVEIIQLRTAFDSERRQLIDSHNDEIKRLNDRYDRNSDSLKDDHKRAMDSTREDNKRQADSLTSSYDHRIKTMELSHQGTENLLKERIESLKNELASIKGELTKTKDEKQKSPLEWVQELVALKDGLSVLRDDDEDDDEDENKATWEKVADRVEPLIGAFASRFGQSVGLTPEQLMLLEQQRQGQLAASQAAEQVTQTQAPEQEEMSKDAERFISFTETAISNGTAPETFVRSAKSLVPKELLDQLVSIGPDALADAVAAQRSESVINSQAGRSFLRKAVEVLKSEISPVENKN
jgi:hypothetical protein